MTGPGDEVRCAAWCVFACDGGGGRRGHDWAWRQVRCAIMCCQLEATRGAWAGGGAGERALRAPFGSMHRLALSVWIPSLRCSCGE